MATKPIPVVICGRHEGVAKTVSEGIGSDYECKNPATRPSEHIIDLRCVVVHFIPTTEAGVAELPLILQGVMPTKIENSAGSGNIAGLAKAVILGGGYDEAAFQTIKAAVDAAKLQHKPVWLRKDDGRPSPPFNADYGRLLSIRVREMLKKLEDEKKLDGSDGGIYLF